MVVDETSPLAEQVASASWYHCIELPGGIVTPGEYDLPDTLRRVPLPTSLHGKRCLDIGTRDGFWAFEMEKRGASEVVGIDLDDYRELDWPAPVPDLDESLLEELDRRLSTFAIAARALDSKVERVNLSVYDLSPERVGTFDYAFLGTLLHHLRDPVGALMAARRVVTGELLANCSFSVPLSVTRPFTPAADLLRDHAPFWWVPNLTGVRRQFIAAGYDIVQTGRPYLMRYGPSFHKPKVSDRGNPLAGVVTRAVMQRGFPHIWIRARPRA